MLLMNFSFFEGSHRVGHEDLLILVHTHCRLPFGVRSVIDVSSKFYVLHFRLGGVEMLSQAEIGNTTFTGLIVMF